MSHSLIFCVVSQISLIWFVLKTLSSVFAWNKTIIYFSFIISMLCESSALDDLYYTIQYNIRLLWVDRTQLNTRDIKVKVNQSTCISPCVAQTTLKRSGMDHTAFNLQKTPWLPLPRKRLPDGASTECGGGHLIAAHYSFIDPESMKGRVGIIYSTIQYINQSRELSVNTSPCTTCAEWSCCHIVCWFLE